MALGVKSLLPTYSKYCTYAKTAPCVPPTVALTVAAEGLKNGLDNVILSASRMGATRFVLTTGELMDDFLFTCKVYTALMVRFVVPVLALWVSAGYGLSYLFGG